MYRVLPHLINLRKFKFRNYLFIIILWRIMPFIRGSTTSMMRKSLRFVKKKVFYDLFDILNIYFVGWIHATRLCSRLSCGSEMKLCPRKDHGKVVYVWRCYSCKSSIGMRNGTWFNNSCLSLSQILYQTYLWCVGSSQKHCAEYSGCSRSTVMKW